MFREILILVLHFIIAVWSQNICICVPTGSCNNNSSSGSTDGTGLIDPRIVNSNGNSNVQTGTNQAITSPASSGITTIINSPTSCQNNLERCCLSNGFQCGIRYPPVQGAKRPSGTQAAFGAYPWQAVILSQGDVYTASGALIDHLHVLTAAHKVNDFLTSGQQLKVRLGEWDASNSNEPLSAQEFIVDRIFVHPQFISSNLKNNIAILRLSNSVQLGQIPTITTACIPSDYVTNLRCWVAGWGRNTFSSGSFQAIQKQVDVPIVDQTTCQNQLRSTRLGNNFQLDNFSFMCAGGEAGKDACTGDGGSPLMCSIAGKWYVVGLVAWGIGCGTSNVPGVYVNVVNYLGWIQQTTSS